MNNITDFDNEDILKEVKLILDYAPIGFNLLDKNMRIIRLNNFVEKILGMKTEEVRGKHCFEVAGQYANDPSKKGREKICDNCGVVKALEDGKIHVFERVLRPDFVIRNTAVPIKEKGEVIGILEIIQDVTEKVKLEDELKKSETRYRELWDNANDMFYIHDLNGTFIDANKMALRTFGYSREDLGKLNIAEVVDPEYLNLVTKKIQEIVEKREPLESFELLCLTKDKRKIWIEVRPRPLIDGGEVVAIQGVGRDITERKRMEEELKERERKFRSIFDSTMDVIYILNLDGVILDVNPAVERFGYSRDELIGKPIYELFTQEAKKSFKDKLSRFIERGYLFHETEIISKSGKIISIECSASAVYDENKNIRFIVSIHRDITERKKLERTLSELNDVLRLLNKILRHDILNDLSAIKAAIEFSLETGDKDILYKILERIDRSASLIKQMRELEELARFRELKAVRIRDVLHDVCERYGEEVEINIHGDGVVEANEALTSVFNNLIGNSVKHGRATRIDITVEERGDVYEIMIVDDGKGIPDEIKGLIFDEGFSYGDTQGSGLGLYISKRIVEAYNGTIEVGESKSGAVFIIRLKKAR